MPKQITSPITEYRRANDRMSQEAFGALFSPPVDKSTVHRWENGSVRISAERAMEIERITGVSRHVIRPDIFGPASEVAA
jgi:DNA-binding transcriptional regulator YdaS (Cro superfamily)